MSAAVMKEKSLKGGSKKGTKSLSTADLQPSKNSHRWRYRKYLESADYISKNVVIAQSQIKVGGGGAYTLVPIKRGTVVGYYIGKRGGKENEDSDYLFEGEPGGRDAADPEGLLMTFDGRIIKGEDIKAKTFKDGTKGVWQGVHSNWTRFINHSSPAFRNIRMRADYKFGWSHALYAIRNIKAGEELFYTYGPGYFSSRGYVCKDPTMKKISPVAKEVEARQEAIVSAAVSAFAAEASDASSSKTWSPAASSRGSTD
eukprot:Clim_evm13s18 gene=Clim_evmTU13s18